jgi:hypothetical protein
MKSMPVLSRLAVISLAAVAFAALTRVYGASVRLPLPNPGWQAERGHRPPAPDFNEFPDFAGEGLLLIFFAVVGRIVLRLRLSPASRSEGQPLLLGLRHEAKIAQAKAPSIL